MSIVESDRITYSVYENTGSVPCMGYLVPKQLSIRRRIRVSGDQQGHHLGTTWVSAYGMTFAFAYYTPNRKKRREIKLRGDWCFCLSGLLVAMTLLCHGAFHTLPSLHVSPALRFWRPKAR
jgi:hypothetical protein